MENQKPSSRRSFLKGVAATPVLLAAPAPSVLATQVAAHNPKFFDGSTPNNPSFLTQDEESSGIIDAAEVLGEGWFLLDVQVHKANQDVELVEGGQLLALFVDPGVGFTSCRSDRDDEDDDDRRHHR